MYSTEWKLYFLGEIENMSIYTEKDIDKNNICVYT